MAESRVLYWGSGSAPCWRAVLAIEEKGIPFESKLVQFAKKEHKSPEVLALNPRGQLPAFKDGDAVVNESGAILTYLESQYPEKPLLPSDAPTKARVLQRMFEALVLDSKFRPYVFPKMMGVEDPQEEQHVVDLKAELELWNGYAGKYKFIASDSFTLADVMFAPVVLSMNRFGLTFENHSNLKNYYETVKEYPSVVKSWPPHWKEGPPTKTFMSIF